MNLHSTQDVCATCGPTIENVLGVLRREVLNYFKKAKIALECAKNKKKLPENCSYVEPFGGCDLSDTFSLFATVSSSSTYRVGYLKRPNSTLEEHPDYFTTYTQSNALTKGSFDIAKLDGKALYFWVPKLRGIILEKEENCFHVTVQQGDSVAKFKQLIEITLDKARCPENITVLSLAEGIELSTKSDDKTVMCPRAIAKLTYLRSLNMARTNARSGFLCELFTPLTSLVSLNLNGAIVHYKEADDHKRENLFKQLVELPQLEELSLEDNKINVTEFFILISAPSQKLEKITRLSLANNVIFDMTAESISIVNNAINKFTSERPNTKIDAKNNGEIPQGLNVDKINTGSESIRKEKNPQEPTKRKTKLSDLTDHEWKKLTDALEADKMNKGTITKVKNGTYTKGSGCNTVFEKAKAMGFISN